MVARGLEQDFGDREEVLPAAFHLLFSGDNWVACVVFLKQDCVQKQIQGCFF